MKVAVLDTGVYAAHPEFDGGRVEAGFTFDLSTGEASAQTPSVDADGHGTHVAGLVCGKHVGVAPNAQVVSGVMIPKGTGSLAHFVVAMGWAASRPDLPIVNLSAGLPGYIAELREPVESLRACGVLVVAAIGNDGPGITRSPANCPEALSVGSFGTRGLSSFCSSGTLLVDSHIREVPTVLAPGEAILSCVAPDRYEEWNGTSMASPQIAGLAACLLERAPGLALSDLRVRLVEITFSSSPWLEELRYIWRYRLR